MIGKQLRFAFVVAGLGLSTVACTNPYSPGQRAAGGALIGGGTGAAVGALAGGGQGALIGAGVGAGGGFAYDQSRRAQQRSFNQGVAAGRASAGQPQ